MKDAVKTTKIHQGIWGAQTINLGRPYLERTFCAEDKGSNAKTQVPTIKQHPVEVLANVPPCVAENHWCRNESVIKASQPLSSHFYQIMRKWLYSLDILSLKAVVQLKYYSALKCVVDRSFKSI